MIQLGNIALPRGMVWQEQFEYTGVVQEMRQTLGGRAHVYSRTPKGAMPITLASLDDQGWALGSVVRALEALAAQPSGSYTLRLGAQTYIVAFRHYEPPVISASPLIPRTVPLDTDLFELTLRLVAYNP